MLLYQGEAFEPWTSKIFTPSEEWQYLAKFIQNKEALMKLECESPDHPYF